MTLDSLIRRSRRCSGAFAAVVWLGLVWSITSSTFAQSNSKDYIYLGGRVIAIENPVQTAPVLSVSQRSSGTFTQGQTGGTLIVTVSNTASASSSAAGTTTVTETLPAGFSAASFSGTGWSCSGSNAVACTSTQAVAGGASFNDIDITLNVPTTAVNPTVTNTATASGGGATASATGNTVSSPVVQVPTSMTAGFGTSPQSTAISTAFGTALSVTLKDTAGNTVSGASVTFAAPVSGASGTFSNATNTITVTTNPSGVASAGSFTANLLMGGPYSVTASSGSLTAINFSLGNTVGAATHLSVSAPSSATSGTSFSVTVTALDAGGNTATGYAGTVRFASTDGSPTLPSNSTLNSGAETFSATLVTAGNQTITATDTVTSSITGTSGQINVTALPVLSVSEGQSGTFTQGQTGGTLTVLVSNIGSVATAGTTTVTETLPANFTAASFSGSGWSCSGLDSNAVTCSSTQVVSGNTTFPIIYITVRVPADASSPIYTNAATASGGGASAIATSNTVPVPLGTVPLLSVSQVSSGTFTQGRTGGTLTLTVSNIGGASISTSGTTTVTEALPTGFSAASFSASGWNCSGTNAVTCTSTQAVVGGASFNVIGINVSVPANAVNPTTTNAATASGGGASASATSGTVSFPAVQVPASMTAGSGTSPQSAAINTAFGTALSVTVKDAAGNTVSGVSVTFAAPLSGASGTFSNAMSAITVTTNASGLALAGSFTANLLNGGPYYVTASSGSLTAVNFSMTNVIGAATHFSVSAPPSATSGTSFSVTVTALDASGNTVTAYGGTVHITSSDGAAALSGNSTLGSGTKTFSATLNTVGYQTITATDMVSSSITGTSAQILTSPPAATQLAFATTGSASAGTAGIALTDPVLVWVEDGSGKLVTTSAVTVTLSASPIGGLSSTVSTNAVNGVATFAGLSFANSANYTLTAKSPGLVDATTTILVKAPSQTVAKFLVTAPSWVTSGVPFTFVVTAQDQSGSTVTSYSGTVHFRTNNGQEATLPYNSGLTEGTGSFSATLVTGQPASYSITATDTTTSVTGSVWIPVHVASAIVSTIVEPSDTGVPVGLPIYYTFSASSSDRWGSSGDYLIFAISPHTTLNLLDNTLWRDACIVEYHPADDHVYLVTDNGGDWLTGTMYTGSPVHNTQCTVGMNGAVTHDGAGLTVTLPITVSTAFLAANNSGTSTPWLHLIVWPYVTGYQAVDSWSLQLQPAAIIPDSTATGQSATIGTQFGAPLKVTLADTAVAANLMPGVSVTFTAPAPSSGASGLFSNGTNTITVTTDASGAANAGVFTANSTRGPTP